jgi:hypothetical protein
MEGSARTSMEGSVQVWREEWVPVWEEEELTPEWVPELSAERVLEWVPPYRHAPADYPPLQSVKTNPDPSRRYRRPAV